MEMDGGEAKEREKTLNLARGFARSAVILWRSELLNAAMKNCDAFIGATVRLTPATSPQLWVFEEPLAWPHQDLISMGGEYAIAALLVVPPDRTPGDMCFVALFRDVQKTLPRSIDEGREADYSAAVWVSPQYDLSEPLVTGAAAACAGLAFLDQEFVGLERQTLPRHLRRAADLKRRPPLPEINVMTLRRSVRDDRPTDGDGEPREWSCQWIVGAHWRRQWMPSKATWEPRYIKPYLKGDPNKPLREPKGPVYVVSR